MEEPTEKHKTVQKPRRSGGQLLVVALLGVGLGILGTLYAQDLIEVITPVALTILLTLFAVGVLLYLAITFYRDKIIRYLFGEDIHFDSALTDAQDMVKQTIIGTTEAIPGLDPSKKKQLQQAAPRMANYLIWSRFRSQGLRMMVGFMVAIGGLATTILLFNQNKLLEKQNDKIDMQMSLEESNRRSTMMSQMANVLDKIDEELRDTFNTNHGTRRLSAQLIGRVASLSTGLKPYQYLDGDSLSKELSPERGLLLLALVNSELDTATLSQIYSKATFKNALLKDVSFDSVFLKRIDLRGADLSDSYFYKVNMKGALLESAIFSNALLHAVDLSESVCWNATFTDLNHPKGSMKVTTQETGRNINLGFYLNEGEHPNINFRNAKLTGATFTNALIRNCNFSGAFLQNSILDDADLTYSRLSFANLRSASLISTSLEETDIAYAEFSGSKLLKVDFLQCEMEGTYFDFASFADCKNLLLEQLSQAETVYKATGLTKEWLKKLEESKPNLFNPKIDTWSKAFRDLQDVLNRPPN